MDKYYQQYIVQCKTAGKYRQLPQSSHEKTYIDFSTNDYLALSRCPDVIQAAISAAQQYGVGATGSRLLSGNYELIEVLEAQIAQDKRTEAALVFNTGFQANISVLATLLNRQVLKDQPLVFFDQCNHASLYQAVFLSGAQLIRYHHNDMTHLASLLQRYVHDPRPKFMVAETVFGMDGDVLPVHDFIALAKEHHAFIYFDEAHATGLMGPHGYGLSTTVSLQGIPHLIMGTFSKALGSSGGYIACSQSLKAYLINKTPGFIYTTAHSPMVIGAVYQAWQRIKELAMVREQLWQRAAMLREQLVHLGWNIGATTTHIIPLILGQELQVMRAKEQLQENGLLVSCVRPPTVPPNTARLRIALNSTHREDEIAQLIRILQSL